MELTEEVDDDAAVGEPPGGVAEVGAALRGHDPDASGRRHAAGVRVRVAEVEQHHRRPLRLLLLLPGHRRCWRGRARASRFGAAAVAAAPGGGGGHGAEVLADGHHGRRRHEGQRQHHHGHHNRRQHAEVLQRQADHLPAAVRAVAAAVVGGACHGGRLASPFELSPPRRIFVSLNSQDSTTVEKYTCSHIYSLQDSKFHLVILNCRDVMFKGHSCNYILGGWCVQVVISSFAHGMEVVDEMYFQRICEVMVDSKTK
jgi:hypothetical protein